MKSITAIIAFVFLISSNLSSETVRVSTIEGSPVSDVSSIILKEIYRRAGHTLEVIPMPAVRATIQSTSGEIDRETHRVMAYGKAHPELTGLSIPFYCIDTVLFARDDSLALKVPVERINQFSIAILKGVTRSLELTQDFDVVTVFDNSEKMMRFLSMDRVDYVLLSRLNGSLKLKELGIEGISSYEPPLERTCLYHYLHNNKSYLIPQLEEVIKDMTLSGQLDQLIRETEKKVTE